MSTDQDCPDEAIDLVHQSKLEGFPDRDAMSTNRYVLSGIQTLLLILGLVVNFIICYVMVKRRRIKKNLSNFFLFNLSLTELLLWLVVLPMTMVVSMSKIHSTVPCKILAFSIFTCAAVIFGLLTAIAFDRYTHIINPLQAIVMEERKLSSLALIWIIAIATSAPFLFSVTMRSIAMEFESSNVDGVVTVRMSIHRGSDVMTSRSVNVTHRAAARILKKSVPIGNASDVMGLNSTGDTTTRCIVPMQLCDIPANVKGQASCVVFFVVSFVIPLILISFAYAKIVQRLWVRCQATDAQGMAAKATLRAVRMLVLVVLAFLLTDGPWTVGCLMYSFRPRALLPLPHHFTAIAIVTTLFYASAVITPTIHTIHSSTVKKEVVAVLCCRFRDNVPFSSTSSLLSTKKHSSAIHFAKNQEKINQDSKKS